MRGSGDTPVGRFPWMGEDVQGPVKGDPTERPEEGKLGSTAVSKRRREVVRRSIAKGDLRLSGCCTRKKSHQRRWCLNMKEMVTKERRMGKR